MEKSVGLNIGFFGIPREVEKIVFDEFSLEELFNLRSISSGFKQDIDKYLKEELRIKQMACGEFFTIILLKNGRCLGMGCNKFGQLGFPKEVEFVSTPREILGISRIKKIATGSWHTLLLSEKGNVFGMGKNKTAQLNFDKELVENVFLPTKIPEMNNVQDIAAHNLNSAFLHHDQKTTMCGFEGNFKTIFLGSEKKEIQLLQTNINIEFKIKSVACGQDHVLILTETNEAFGIGSNECGQLGLKEEIEHVNEFTRLLPGVKISCIQAGSFTSLMLSNDNQLFVTGHNNENQLGLKENTNFGFRLVPGLENIRLIATNDFHTLILKQDNTIFCFGENNLGQLGIKNKKKIKKPIQLEGIFKFGVQEQEMQLMSLSNNHN